MHSHHTDQSQADQLDGLDGLDHDSHTDPYREARPTIGQYAEDAYQAVRAINHATITRRPIPAPVVYEILGNLKQLSYALDQALGQISTGLAASLEAPSLFEVYEADGSDPAESVASARAALHIGCAAAYALATDIERAQGYLTWQGYRPVPGPVTDPVADGDL